MRESFTHNHLFIGIEHSSLQRVAKHLDKRVWRLFEGTRGINYDIGSDVYIAGGLLGMCIYTATLGFLRNGTGVCLMATDVGIWLSNDMRASASIVEKEVNEWKRGLAVSGLPADLLNKLTVY